MKNHLLKKKITAIALTFLATTSIVLGSSATNSKIYFKGVKNVTSNNSTEINAADFTPLAIVVVLVAMVAAQPEPQDPKKPQTLDFDFENEIK
jgi:type 1 fimbria pilin